MDIRINFSSAKNKYIRDTSFKTIYRNREEMETDSD